MKRKLGFCCVLGASAIAVGGCFPYRETYRPLIAGRVVDENGAPVQAVSVETCSDGSWSELTGCPRRGTTTTSTEGKFELKSVKEIDMCCLGEAPLPRTIVSVCLPDGRVGGAYVDGPEPVWITVPVGSPETLTPWRSGYGLERRYNESKAEVTKRCADPSNGGQGQPSSPEGSSR